MSTNRDDSSSSQQGMDNRTKVRLAVLGVIALVIIVFALSNTDKERVKFVVGDVEMPLIVVIAVSFVIGIVFDRVAIMISRHRRD
jgi:uncharacterized integral membrane protein